MYTKAYFQSITRSIAESIVFTYAFFTFKYLHTIMYFCTIALRGVKGLFDEPTYCASKVCLRPFVFFSLVNNQVVSAK